MPCDTKGHWQGWRVRQPMSVLRPGLLHFAYGCNMDPTGLSAVVGIQIASGWAARLPGWRLTFSQGGEGESGEEVAATLVEAPGCWVYGVVFRLPRDVLPALDAFEGVPEYYRRATLWVEPLGRRGRQAVMAYLGQPRWRVDEVAPPADYLRSVLRGGRHHGLPATYLDWVRHLARGEARDCYRLDAG